MIYRFVTKFRKKLTGILMPIFLFGLFLPQTSVKSSTEKEIIFKIADNAQISEISNQYNILTQPVFADPTEVNFSRIFTAALDDTKLAKMRQDSRILYAEEDGELFASVVTTDDTYFTEDDSKTSLQWYLPKTQIPEAWDYTTGSSDVIVAVLDTGIHARHIELNDGRVIGGYNSMTNETIPANSSSDDNGHGTAVAGILGAITDNDRGVAGINWDIKLMPIKALSSAGKGTASGVARGIVWAADHGANIINLSLGGVAFGTNTTLLSAITYAYNKGVVIVAAAGNDLAEEGANLDNTIVYPVCADNEFNMVIGVAATDINDNKALFSNYGSKCVDVSAPGKKIITTAYLPSEPSNNLLIYGSGTSLAAPIVSGIAALFKAYNPNLSNVEIRDQIIENTDNIDSRNSDQCAGGSCHGFLGSGRVNAYNYFKPKPIVDGSLVRNTESREIYLIQGSMKRKISDFVFIQRGYNPNQVISDVNGSLAEFSSGGPILPAEGTLIKSVNDPTVYIIDASRKHPVSLPVFIARGLSFADVHTLPDNEVRSYDSSSQYGFPDGTLLRVEDDPLVYMIVNQTLRPISYFVFQNRKLSFAKVIIITFKEKSLIKNRLDKYWLPPLDGTLVKSSTDPGVYIIENGKKRLLTYQIFVNRKYKFSNIKTIPPEDLDLIEPGEQVES